MQKEKKKKTVQNATNIKHLDTKYVVWNQKHRKLWQHVDEIDEYSECTETKQNNFKNDKWNIHKSGR